MTAVRPALLLDFANTRALDPRITFTRASTATYYDGKTTAKAEENLLLNSQNITASGWGLTNITATADTTTAPDGTLTADSMFGTNVTNFNSLNAAFAGFLPGETYAVSVFVKKGTMRYISIGLYINTSNNCGAGFDLDTNTVTGTGSIGSGYSASGAAIVDVGGGWYRCSVICVVGTTVPTGFRIFHRTSAYTTGAIGETITASTSDETYIWGAQLEQRSAATAYTPTTTQPITNYVPQLLTAASGVARFDHDPITCESLGLLIEEQRTNLLLRSDAFDNASWFKDQVSVTSNAIIAPDGSLTADKLTESTATATHFAAQSVSGLTVGSTLTFSLYAKAAERTRLTLMLNDGATLGNRVEVAANLTAGTVGTVSNIGTFTGGAASIQAVGGGWFRVSLSGVATGVTSVQVRPYLLQATGGTSYTGDGYSGIYIWGAQLEAGAFPTSYIPTTASQVTRSIDAASMSGTNFSSWYRQDEGTWFMDVIYPQPLIGSVAEVCLVSIDDGTAENRIAFRGVRSTSFTLDATIRRFNSTSFDSNQISYISGGKYKRAISYEFNNTEEYYNGLINGSVDTSVNIPTVNRLLIGGTTSQFMQIRKIAYYPKRLTNAQLQALTK